MEVTGNTLTKHMLVTCGIAASCDFVLAIMKLTFVIIFHRTTSKNKGVKSLLAVIDLHTQALSNSC